MGLWEKPGIGDRVIPNCYGKKFSPKQMFNVSSTAIITYKLLKPLALGLGKVLVLLVVLKIIGSCLLTFHTRHTTHTHTYIQGSKCSKLVPGFHGFCGSVGGGKKHKSLGRKP